MKYMDRNGLGEIQVVTSFVFCVPRIQELSNTDPGRILSKEMGIPVYIDRDVYFFSPMTL